MAKKLGFDVVDNDIVNLIYEILDYLQQNKVDYSYFWRNFLNKDFEGFGDIKQKYLRIANDKKISIKELDVVAKEDQKLVSVK